MIFKYFHPTADVNGKPYSDANVIWAERDQGSPYYRVSRFAMRRGKFPSTHPCAPVGLFDEEDLSNSSQSGSCPGLKAFRARGYWASCFPEGDGMCIDWWNNRSGSFADKSAEQVMKDLRECFGWELRQAQ